MIRRKLLQLGPAAVAALALAPRASKAQGTPIATADSAGLPQTYADVAALYEPLRDRALTEGRLAGSQLLGGELDALVERSSPELQAIMNAEVLDATLQSLETNRLSFAVATLGLFFDGQLTGDTISGFLLSGSSVNGFELTRDAAGSGSPVAVASFAGSWTGQIQGSGGQLIPITTTFSDTADPSGTITIPSLEMTELPLGGIAFDSERPIGDLLWDQGRPIDRSTVSYLGQFAWGSRTLGLTAMFLNDGTMVMFQLAPEAQLPPDPAAGIVSDVAYHLPLDGLWWIIWGGNHPLANYHATTAAQRHAVDAAIWNDGATYRTDGIANADYWIYGRPLLAPADGTVVSVLDGIPENQPAQPPIEGHPAGNHVVIQTGPEEFVFLAHLQPGSIRVADGDRVTAGSSIGLVGNSGNSSEPHLHIHVQNEADLLSTSAFGLPLVFGPHTVDGVEVEKQPLAQGTFVSAART